MPDIAELGFVVDKHGALSRASKDLDNLAKAGDKATVAAKNNASAQRDASTAARDMKRDMAALERSTGRMTAQMISGNVSTRTMTQSIAGIARVTVPAGVAIGAVVGAVGGLLAIADNATRRMRDHEVALALVGRSAGVTTAEMQFMTDALARQSVPLGQATKAMTDMVKAGMRGAENLRQYSQVAVDFARVTGRSVESVAKTFAGLQNDPLNAVKKLDEQMHFLTVSTLQQITAAESVGDRTRASAIAMREAAVAMQQVVDAGSNLGVIERAWKWIKNAAVDAANALLSIGRHTVDDQLAMLEGQLAVLESQSGRNAAAYQVEADALRRLIAEIKARQAEESAVARAAEANALKVESYNLLTQKYGVHMQDAAERTATQRKEMIALANAAGIVSDELEKMLRRFDAATAQKIRAPKVPRASAARADPLDSAAKSYGDQLQRQLLLSSKASESERVLYELQRGRLVGLAPERAALLQSMALEIDKQREMAAAAEDEQRRKAQTASQASGIIEQMRTEEEAIKESYERRRQIMLQYAQDTGNDVTQTLMRLEQERNDKLAALTTGEGGYWDQWLKAAESSLQDFDRLTGDVLQNISGQFGSAFEKMVFDSESLRDAIGGLAEGIARSMVNALGQMAAQWLTYKLVSTMSAKAAGSAGAMAQIANAQATSAQAALAAYASTAAIPIVGPALAPAAAATATAATAPMVAAVSAAAASALAGMAHDGIDSVPQTGTWLLEKGERVTTSETSAKLDSVLSRIETKLTAANDAPRQNVRVVAQVGDGMLRDFMLSSEGEQTFRVLLERNRAVVRQ
jgi:hypothetical protein